MKGGKTASQSLTKAVSLIALVTLLSRVVGLLRWLAQALWVGAQDVGNAYASANQIPNILFEVVAGGALTGMVVPLLAAPIAKNLRTEVQNTTCALLTWTLLILTPLAVLVWVGAEPIMSFLPASAGSNAGAQNALAGAFLRVFALQIPLYGVGVVLSGVLQAHHKFLFPALAPLLSSLVVIATYATYGALTRYLPANQITTQAVDVLAWGTTLGVAALSLPLLIPVKRLGIQLRPCLHLETGQVRRVLALGGAGIGALLAQQLNVISNLFLLRWGGHVGAINVFQYAQAVFMLPFAVLAVPVATAVFPRLSQYHEQADSAALAALCSRALRVIVVLCCLGMALIWALSQAGEEIFSWRKPIPGMAYCLEWMAPALLGFTLLYFLSRVLYAINVPRPAWVGACLGWVGAAAISWVLVLRWYQPAGSTPVVLQCSALAQSVSLNIAALYLLWRVARICRPAAIHAVGLTLGLGLPLSVLAGWLGKLTYRGVTNILGYQRPAQTGLNIVLAEHSSVWSLLTVLLGALAAAGVVALICGPYVAVVWKKSPLHGQGIK